MYRTQIVIIYYSYEQNETTPKPFSEIRLIIYSRTKINIKKYKDQILKTIIELEWLFPSLRHARLQNQIMAQDPTTTEYEDERNEIIGQEINLEVERKEMLLNLAELTTPIPIKAPIKKQIAIVNKAMQRISRNINQYLNKIFRYVIFYDTEGDKIKTYTELDIELMTPLILAEAEKKKETLGKFIRNADFSDLYEIFGEPKK